MIVQTTPGDTYAVTATIPCTVHALRGKEEIPVLVLTIETTGQYLIVAPTTTLEVSDEAALVTKSFRSAPAARSLSGGGCTEAELADYAKISIQNETTFNPSLTRPQTLYILQTNNH